MANQGYKGFSAKNVKNVFNGEMVVAEADIKVKLGVKNGPSQYQHDTRAASSQEKPEPELEDRSG
jgi:hypothetical protein